MLRVFLPGFLLFRSSFLLYVDVRVTCSHACHALLGSVCLCALCHALCLYAWIHVPPCLYANFLYVYAHASMPICLDLGFHMLVCLGLFSLLALCACALHAMIVCLDLGYVCHAMCYCRPFVALSFFLVFLPNG